MRLVAPSALWLAITRLASERNETEAYHSVSQPYADRERPPHDDGHRDEGPGRGAGCAPRRRRAGELPGQADPRSSTAPKTSPPTMLCLKPTASIARRPGPEGVGRRDAAYGPQREPARAEHERDAEQLALGGHRVDLGVADHRGGRHRDPAAAAAARGVVGDARADGPSRASRPPRPGPAARTRRRRRSRWAYAPPTASVACISQMIGGGGRPSSGP